jgi:hypothetical protein
MGEDRRALRGRSPAHGARPGRAGRVHVRSAWSDERLRRSLRNAGLPPADPVLAYGRHVSQNTDDELYWAGHVNTSRMRSSRCRRAPGRTPGGTSTSTAGRMRTTPRSRRTVPTGSISWPVSGQRRPRCHASQRGQRLRDLVRVDGGARWRIPAPPHRGRQLRHQYMERPEPVADLERGPRFRLPVPGDQRGPRGGCQPRLGWWEFVPCRPCRRPSWATTSRSGEREGTRRSSPESVTASSRTRHLPREPASTPRYMVFGRP